MLEGLEEHLEVFKEEWSSANEISSNLKWAIFPVGSEEIEFQAAKQLMHLFENLEGFIYFKEGQDPSVIVRALEDMLSQYKKSAKDKLVTATKKDGYTLTYGIVE